MMWPAYIVNKVLTSCLTVSPFTMLMTSREGVFLALHAAYWVHSQLDAADT